MYQHTKYVSFSDITIQHISGVCKCKIESKVWHESCSEGHHYLLSPFFYVNQTLLESEYPAALNDGRQGMAGPSWGVRSSCRTTIWGHNARQGMAGMALNPHSTAATTSAAKVTYLLLPFSTVMAPKKAPASKKATTLPLNRTKPENSIL